MSIRRTVDSLIRRLFLRSCLIGGSVMLAALPGLAAATALNLTQVPSVGSLKSIAPNLILMMDDTGPMQNEWIGTQGVLGVQVSKTYQDYKNACKNSNGNLVNCWQTPGTATGTLDYGFPVGSSVPYGTGSTPAKDYVPGFNEKNNYAMQFRSGFVNPNYYNPTITYTPWACSAAYPESSSTAPSYTPAVGGSCQWNANLGLWLWPNASPGKSYLSPENPAEGYRAVNTWNDSTDPTNSTSDNGYVGDDSGTNSLYWLVYNPGTGSGNGTTQFVQGPYPATWEQNPNNNSQEQPQSYGFWPATYWDYWGPRDGPSQNTLANGSYYKRVQICPASTVTVDAPTYDGSSSVSVTACTQPPVLTLPVTTSNLGRTYTFTSGSYTDPQGNPITCGTGEDACYVYVTLAGSLVVRTYEEEIQNFANWYQYYRSHILMAQAAASQAFMSLPTGFRVDYARLNHMSVAGNVPADSTVDLFRSSERATFLQNLFGTTVTNNTQCASSVTPDACKPSRLAVAGIGKWLSAAPNSTAPTPPWGTDPAEQAATGQINLSCRQNYLLFLTDGAWDGPVDSTTAAANADSNKGPTITGPNSQSYTYSPAPPYNNYDSSSLGAYSLANVAMYYWENDLQTGSGMQNDVPTNSADPAFWQHMTTFAVGLGVTPYLVFDYMKNHPGVDVNQAQAAVYAQLAINPPPSSPTQWPTNSCWDVTCTGSETAQISDLWHAGVDGHGGFFSARNPIQLAAQIRNALLNIINRAASSSSVAVNTVQGHRYQPTATQIYQPLFHPQNWWGQLLAEPILINTLTGEPYISTTPVWDGSCVLTGTGASTACPQGDAGNSYFTQPGVGNNAHPGRQILTWNGTQGVPFEWTSSPTSTSMTATQLADLATSIPTCALNSDPTSENALNYLRGDRTCEVSFTGGSMRTRTSVLGDIVDSSPAWVGYPDLSYPSTSGQPTTWKDSLYPTSTMPEDASGAQTYQQFSTAEESRKNVVYIGANDGFLHGFSAGHYVMSSGQLTYDSSDNNGQEVLAYMPQAIISDIAQYASTNYTHHFFVDASPETGDLFYGGAWHTWLVGGVGGGGKDLYALDITHPSQFSESNAASLVKGDWTPSQLNAYASCYVNGSLSSNCGDYLGYTYGTPLIRRFHNGDWGVIWGNGLNSTNGKAGIYIGLIDHTTGAWKIYYLGTGYGAAQDPSGESRPDGIVNTTSADLDHDHTVDYIYAGDYFGNVWRFNVTSQNPANWHVSTYGNSSATPLFSAANSADPQPITTQVQVLTIPDASTGLDRLMVEFGTGSRVLNGDSTANTTPGGVNSLYGIWDWDMSGWNNISTTHYDSLSAPQTITRSALQQQTIIAEVDSSGQTYTGQGTGSRILSNNSVCWVGSTLACPSGSTPNTYGWYLDLISPRNVGVNGRQGEKVIYNPKIENGVLLFNTTIPTSTIGLTCNPIADAGWTMALDPRTGGRLNFEPLYYKNGKLVQISYQGTSVYTSGITYGAVGTPSFMTFNGQKYMVISTRTGQTGLMKANLGNGLTGGRLTWVQLR